MCSCVGLLLRDDLIPAWSWTVRSTCLTCLSTSIRRIVSLVLNMSFYRYSTYLSTSIPLVFVLVYLLSALAVCCTIDIIMITDTSQLGIKGGFPLAIRSLMGAVA